MRFVFLFLPCLCLACGLPHGYMRPCSTNSDCQTDQGLVCARIPLGDESLSQGGYCTYTCTGADTGTGACPEIHCPMPRMDPTKCRPAHHAGGAQCNQGVFLDSSDTGLVCGTA